MPGLLARRDFRLFITGQTLSTLADNAVFVALGVWAKELTGSSSAAGLVLLSYTVPMLLLPIGGYAADRFPRGPLLVTANLALAALSLPLLLVTGPSGTWIIHVVAVLYGLAAVVLGPAQSAVLRGMLSGEAELGAAIGLSQSMRSGTVLLAPLLGASLLGWAGGRVFTLVNIVLLLAAALLFVLLPGERRAPQEEAQTASGVLAGLRHLRATRGIHRLLVALTTLLLAVGLLQPMLYALLEHGLHRPPRFMGVLETTLAVGSLAGSVAGGFLIARLGSRRLMRAGAVLFGTGAALLTVPAPSTVLPGLVLAGAGTPAAVIGLATAAQAATPGHLMGRTQAVVNLILTVPQAISLGVGSALVAVLSFRQMVAVMIIGCLAVVTLLGPRRAGGATDRNTSERQDGTDRTTRT
ncbi:MFS transporter [Streptomyces lannensis]|uniref:MFS transporter n=1 Tax=Streptomyces lannensis TaxID=766498 RepID=A0ABP7L1F3_9ACTN